MGSVGKALDPTGGNFLGMGNTVGRLAGDVATGGMAEFGRKDSFFLPPSIAGPLKIGAGTIGGGMLGGPAGSFLGGTLGGMLGGNTQGGMVGGGLGGLIQSLISGGGGGGGLGAGNLALGGSLLGLGLSQNTDIPNVPLPSMANDQNSINAEKGNQQSLIDKLMSQQQGLNSSQNDLLGQRMTSQREQLLNQLTNGPEGEAFREKYNNLGLLNSGAFNTGLANQFGNLASQQQQDILNLGITQNQGLQDTMKTGYGVQSNLGLGGLERQFGLEDTGTQMTLARALAQAQQKSGLQQSLLGLSGRVLGGGMGGGGGAGAGGGGAGGLFGGNQGFLSSLGSGTGNLISSLLQKFRGGSTLPEIDAGVANPLDVFDESFA